MGCGESEVSLRVIERRNVLLAMQWVQYPGRAMPRGCTGESAAVSPCQDVLYYRAHLARSGKLNQWCGSILAIEQMKACSGVYKPVMSNLWA